MLIEVLFKLKNRQKLFELNLFCSLQEHMAKLQNFVQTQLLAPTKSLAFNKNFLTNKTTLI